MSIPTDERVIEATFAAARTLEPTDEEIASVVARAASRPGPFGRRRQVTTGWNWRRVAAPALAALVLLVGGAYAVPPTRAALDDIAGAFSDWISGDSAARPGRPLGANEQAPDWVRDPRFAGDPRVIAAADGYKLYAAVMRDGSVEFDLGNTGVGLGFDPSGFKERALYVLGPGSVTNADEHGHVPLFGVTARSIRSIELTYGSGPPLRVDGVDGGFVLLAEPDRSPREVIAFDAARNEVARELVDDSDHYGPRIDWSQYGPTAPRVTSECQPGAAGPTPPPACGTR
jgi:hypothetical protein